MTSTHRTDPPADRSAGRSSERSVLMDLMAFTPSATLGRELLALFANLALVGLIVLVLQPETLVTAVMFAVVGLFMGVRLVVGFRTRGYAADLTGGR
ncbi:MAG: hypothetical protein ACTMII_07405 [Brachybacterium sp.]|uniref:hypothetical protein n=1 Tax=unclassified Brachybacterium TaxID=2623841 RepID=UPI003F90CEA0